MFALNSIKEKSGLFLKKKTIIMAVAVLAVLAISSSVMVSSLSRLYEKSFAESAAMSLARFSDLITLFFESKEAELNTFASSNEVRAADSSIHSFANETGEIQILGYKKSRTEERIRALCKNFAESDGDIAEIYLGTKWGGYATNFDGSMTGGYDPRKRGWYETATSGEGKVMITDAFASTVGATVVGLTRSVYDAGGSFLGNASIEVSLDTLTEILSRMDFGEGSFLMLLQKDGTVLADTHDAGNNFKNIDESDIPDLRKALSSDGSIKTLRIEGSTFFMRVVKNERTDYQIAAFSPKRTVFATFRKTLGTIIPYTILIVVIFAALVIYSIRRFLQKERRTGEKLTSEIQNLSVAAKENAATGQDQNAAVKEIVATMEDNNALAETVAQKITDVSSVAGRTNGNVHEGVELLARNVAQLSEIASANQTTIEGIKTLGDKIENIWDIVTLINSVADQAKIIAFNAELEASAAGEAGKNFHIVATEIRRLADGIIDGTKEIKEKITEIQERSDSLILASENGTAKINEGRESAKTLEEKFADIRTASEITAESAGDITGIIKQQAAASEQILATLRQISLGIDSFTQATESISGASEKLRGIAEELSA